MNYITAAETVNIQIAETMLLDLLQHRFKTIPDAYRHQIEQANVEALLKWSERILCSKSLEDVFKP
jgi:hypothetical protein